jgi:hypothetical protein
MLISIGKIVHCSRNLIRMEAIRSFLVDLVLVKDTAGAFMEMQHNSYRSLE